MRALADEDWVRRFKEKIDTRSAGADECDIWTGALSDEGYGVVRVGSKVVRAHRVAYMLAFGPVPEDRPILDHVYRRIYSPTCARCGVVRTTKENTSPLCADCRSQLNEDERKAWR